MVGSSVKITLAKLGGMDACKNGLITLLLILIALPTIVIGQDQKKKLYKKYGFADGRFYRRLDLFTDSSFVYEFEFKLGGFKCNGKWRIVRDTLKLLDVPKPWSIAHIQEQKIDSIKGKIIVKLITADRVIINGFGVRINNNCDTTIFTDKDGIAEFHIASIDKLYIDYDEEYIVSDRSKNSFIVTLDSYPIHSSPKQTTWRDWIIIGQTISPIECGKILNNVKLRRIRRK